MPQEQEPGWGARLRVLPPLAAAAATIRLPTRCEPGYAGMRVQARLLLLALAWSLAGEAPAEVVPPTRAAATPCRHLVTPPLRHAPASLAAGAFEPLENEGLPPFAQGLYMINTLVGEAVDSTDFLNAIMVRPPRGGAADFLCVLGSFLLASCGGWPPRAVAAALCRGSCAASLQYAAHCAALLLPAAVLRTEDNQQR